MTQPNIAHIIPTQSLPLRIGEARAVTIGELLPDNLEQNGGPIVPPTFCVQRALLSLTETPALNGLIDCARQERDRGSRDAQAGR
jgi:hypothetical protein